MRVISLNGFDENLNKENYDEYLKSSDFKLIIHSNTIKN